MSKGVELDPSPSKEGLDKTNDKQTPSKEINIRQNKKNLPRAAEKGLEKNVIRHTIVINKNLLESIKAYAYWERERIQDVFDTALRSFLSDKKRPPIPEDKRRRKKT